MIHPAQTELLLVDDVMRSSVSDYAKAAASARGEVLTRPEVAEFILDLIGWRTGNNLAACRLLEPSCGSGDFLLSAVDRLLRDTEDLAPDKLTDAIRGVEINREAFEIVRSRLENRLTNHGLKTSTVKRLCNAWLIQSDFLTEKFSGTFTHVVGNPPYVRLEALPKPLMRFYRERYATMYDRSDLYIAFFEKGLALLENNGHLGYICSDRWMKNRYGGPLRRLIAAHYHLDTCIDFSGCDAFREEVIAYPAVTVIRKGQGKRTRVVRKGDVSIETLPDLSNALRKERKDPRVHVFYNIAAGDAPWLLSNAERLEVIQSLERRLPTLEEAGCRIGIGVATGADNVFIGDDNTLTVEPERRLPLVTRRDLVDGRVAWSGLYVLNPYSDQGKGLVNPDLYPAFKTYIEAHRTRIQQRHVARKNPGTWFKTIDRINPDLLRQPKLLIPDIQDKPQVAYDDGCYYPHHNLYFVLSKHWDLKALQAVLRSSLTQAFVATYSLRMRGDFLRFQAQYLRRIRLPYWNDVDPQQRRQLARLGESGSIKDIDSIVRRVYKLSESAWSDLFSG